MNLKQLQEAAREAARERLEDYPNRWNDAQIDTMQALAHVRRLARELSKDADMVELYRSAYNEKAQEYEAFVEQQRAIVEQVTVPAVFAAEHGMEPVYFERLYQAGYVPGAIKRGRIWLMTQEAAQVALQSYQRRKARKGVKGDKKQSRRKKKSAD